MKIDEGTYLVLQSAAGAFTRRFLPMLKEWNPVDRQHIAVLIPGRRGVFRVYMTTPPSNTNGGSKCISVADMDNLPDKSIVEIRHHELNHTYYRKDDSLWVKIAEAADPFSIEVFSYGIDPFVIQSVIPA